MILVLNTHELGTRNSSITLDHALVSSATFCEPTEVWRLSKAMKAELPSKSSSIDSSDRQLVSG